MFSLRRTPAAPAAAALAAMTVLAGGARIAAIGTPETAASALPRLGGTTAPTMQPATEAGASAPRALYVAACGSCHGAEGRGNRQIDAPALAGLSAAYFERQIDGFRRGYRGHRPEDLEGREMRPMVEGLTGADAAALGAWLASLPGDAGATDPGAGAADEATAGAGAGGDPARGQATYAACAVCHGRSGEGNDALGAPRLAGQAGWYTARQLGKFIDGVRGAHPDDAAGASMRASVGGLTRRDVADVVAWIDTLREPGSVR